MFCSNCGKSILPEESSCRHCGASYGKERFYGNTYTSAQVRIPASKLNDAPVGGKVAYTRTDYFEDQPADDIYSNTSYRPLLREEDDLTLIEAERAEQEAEEEARLQAEEDARRAEEERIAQQEAQYRAENEAAAEFDDAADFEPSENGEEYTPADEQVPYQNDEADFDDYYAEGKAAEYEKSEGPEESEYEESEYEAAQYEQDTENVEDVVEDVVEDSPLPDDLADAVISDAVLAHMERQRLDEERRANNALRMAPLMNLTKKFTPSFGIFGKKNAPAAQESVEDVQVEYEQDTYYDAQADADYADADYDAQADANYADADYDAQADADYADADYDAQADADYADADYDAQTDADYADADYDAQADADYADADYDTAVEGTDEYAAFEDGEQSAPAFNFDLSAILDRLNLNANIKEFIRSRAITIAAAAVLIVAVIISGVVWLNFITEQRSKIVDVTYNTYQKGIEMLKNNADEQYRSEMQSVYITNASFANTSFAEDMQAFNALLPTEPLANDSLFVITLTNIQNAIEDAIKADAENEKNGTTAENASASELRWQAISNAIDKLSKATMPSELTVIVTDLEQVVSPSPSPSPTPPAVQYETLTNGMRDSVEVKKLQIRLYTLGFLEGDEQGKYADGDFGTGTETAVKAFQRAAGLNATGIADQETQTALYADDAPSANSVPSNPVEEG